MGFGRTCAGAAGRIADKHAADEVVKASGTVLFTVQNRLGGCMCLAQLAAVKAITTEIDGSVSAA